MAYIIESPMGHKVEIKFSKTKTSLVVDTNFDPMKLLRAIEAEGYNTASLKGGWMVDELHRDSTEGTGWFSVQGGEADWVMSEFLKVVNRGLERMEGN